jgi:hypothetical protein
LSHTPKSIACCPYWRCVACTAARTGRPRASPAARHTCGAAATWPDGHGPDAAGPLPLLLLLPLPLLLLLLTLLPLPPLLPLLLHALSGRQTAARAASQVTAVRRLGLRPGEAGMVVIADQVCPRVDHAKPLNDYIE